MSVDAYEKVRGFPIETARCADSNRTADFDRPSGLKPQWHGRQARCRCASKGTGAVAQNDHRERLHARSQHAGADPRADGSRVRRGTDTLYVASTNDNAIYAVSHASQKTSAAGRGQVTFSNQHLCGPLALRFAPNGDLLAANGDADNADPLHPSEIVEFTKSGRFVRESNVDSSQGGALGLDTVLGDADRGGDDDDPAASPFNYAVVDDVTNSLAVLKVIER
jgi:hypothetical protein